MIGIVMSGIVSASSMRILERGLKRHYDTKLSLDFFCTYSEYEIPLNAIFTRFHNIKTGLSVETRAKLVDITQQWGIPFDVIPMGWKTLARVEFENEETIIFLKKEMPIVNRWGDSSCNFTLVE